MEGWAETSLRGLLPVANDRAWLGAQRLKTAGLLRVAGKLNNAERTKRTIYKMYVIQ